MVSVKPSEGLWAPAAAVHTPQAAAAELPWQDAAEPGPWIAVVRSFHDGHTETWWAAELVYGRYGPQRPVRRLVATTDPRRLAAASSWYIETNLPAPGSRQAKKSPLGAASIAEVVRLYGLRGWIEQSYKQLKNELGWADAMVRAELALRRHWLLIFCAFTFCWLHWLRTASATATGVAHQPPLQSAGKKREPLQWATWPCTLRRVRRRLTPWMVLQRWWQAWTYGPPPAELQRLLDWITDGNALNLYLAPS